MVQKATHPDLISQKEAAELLGVAQTTMAHDYDGRFPRPLPQFKRPLRYSRRVIEAWLEAQIGPQLAGIVQPGPAANSDASPEAKEWAASL